MTMNISRKNWIVLAVVLFAVCTLLQAAVVPQAPQTLELKPGWNLVTLEHPIVDDIEAKSFLALQPMTLDAVAKSYVRCTSLADLKIGAGYWVFAVNEQEIQLTKDQSQTSWETAALKSDWNLLGVADNSDWQGQAAAIWQWLNGHFQKISITELTSGEGYWVTPKQ